MPWTDPVGLRTASWQSRVQPPAEGPRKLLDVPIRAGGIRSQIGQGLPCGIALGIMACSSSAGVAPKRSKKRKLALSAPGVTDMPFPFTCPHCGTQTYVSEQYVGQSGPCAQCGKMITVPPVTSAAPPDLGEDAVVRMLIPVGRSGWAIAAGYAGLFAVLFFPAPIALVLGLVAIWDIRKHPKKHGLGRAIFGLVMGPLFTVPMLFFLIAAALH